MKLYKIYTRQTEPVDNQYFAFYYVRAESELSARAYFQRRLQHAVIQDVYLDDSEEPMILLATR
jgi:hypothetical protein